jgi:hypothetical protein
VLLSALWFFTNAVDLAIFAVSRVASSGLPSPPRSQIVGRPWRDSFVTQSELELWLLALTAVGALLGSLGIFWARSGRTGAIVLRGRVLFVLAELFLAAGAWFAALVRADGLVPLGLAAGFLVILMLWELPQPARSLVSADALADEV